MRSALFIPVILAALLATGCQPSNTYKSEDGTVVVERNEKGEATRVRVKGAESRTASYQAGTEGLPTDYPKDVPVYPGAKVTSSLAGSDKNKEGSMVTFESSAALTDLAAYYRNQLEANGWMIRSSMAVGQTLVIQSAKEHRTLAINIQDNGSIRIWQQTLASAD